MRQFNRKLSYEVLWFIHTARHRDRDRDRDRYRNFTNSKSNL